MKKTFVALGSNLGERKSNLLKAYHLLQEATHSRDSRLSPLYETPAWLPENAQEDWNRPFLNAVAEFTTDLSAEQLLAASQSTEKSLGRDHAQRWAPRPIDIDLLIYGGEQISSPHLQIPHPGLAQRAFVLDPLKDLAPSLKISGTHHTVLELARRHREHQPQWMAILNLTPDSFSDDGLLTPAAALEKQITQAVSDGAHILDLGAESTRPGATAVTPQEEWRRLQPALKIIAQWRREERPWISVDTRHPQTASQALEWGIDIINDVSGLQNPEMQRLARESGKTFVAMHSLSIPADKSVILAAQADPVQEMNSWLNQKMEQWSASGIDLARIIFDPGIGFGKTALQSLKILRQCRSLQHSPLRLLIGHSRKSFMNPFSQQTFAERDWETVGASLALTEMGVDILRVHNLQAHRRAHLAWCHVRTPQ